MTRRGYRATIALGAAALLCLSILTASAASAVDRVSLIQDGLDAAKAHLAAALQALLEPADRDAAEAAVGDAVLVVENVLTWLVPPSADADRQTRVLARRVIGCHQQLRHAREIVRAASSRTSGAALKAVQRAYRAVASTDRALARGERLGPLLELQEWHSGRFGLYDPGDEACFLVRSLDGAGAPCQPLAVTVVSDRAGVTGAAPTTLSTQPLVVGVTLGPTRGIAQITVAACGRVRTTHLVNRGLQTSVAAGTDLLALVDTPANLVAVGEDWLAWSDDSDEPVKAMPAVGGAVMALAARLVAPERITVAGEFLYVLDLQDGFSPGGSVGPAVRRALRRIHLAGPGSLQLASGGNAAHHIATDLVVAGPFVYWVIGEATPPIYTIQRLPVEGGAPVDVYTSLWNAITALSADPTHLYWLETAYPDPGTIKRVPLAGGAAESFYSSPTAIGGGLSVRGDRIYVAESFAGRVVAVPLAGGPAEHLAYTPRPTRLVTDELNVYWLTESALHAVPLAGGETMVLAAGLTSPSDLCVDGAEVFWTEPVSSLPGSTGRVSKVARSGGPATVLADAVRTPVAVAVAGQTVHWCEGGPLAQIEGYGQVAQTPRDGGAVTVTLSGVSRGAPPLAADSVAVYVGDGWTLKRLPMDGSPSAIMASVGFTIAALATDGTLVTWVESDPFGSVRCLPVTGGAVRTLGILNDYAGRITLDDLSAYVVGGLGQIHRFPLAGGVGTVVRSAGIIEDLLATGGALCFADSAGHAVYRMSPMGGAATRLAGFSGRDWSCRLAADGITLFWLTSSTLGRTPLSGAPGQVLFSGLPSDPGLVVPNSIALSGSYAYWTVVLGDGLGAILRTALD